MKRRTLIMLGLAAGIASIVVVGIVLALDTGSAEPAQIRAGLGPGALAVERGPTAPDIGGTDVVTGEPVNLADFAGKPLVVNIWASWCPPCREEAPDIRRFVESNPQMTMVGIDFQDTVEDARAFYQEFGWTHPSIFDPSGDLALELGLLGLPTTVFYDREQREVARVVGGTDLAGLEHGLSIAAAPAG